MSYSEPLVRQTQVFLVFFGAGCLLRLVFSAFDFLRLLCGEKRVAAYVSDTLFCFTALLVLFFLFLAFTNGRVRLVLLWAAGAGFAVTQRCVGRLLQDAGTALARWVRRAARVLLLPFLTAWHDVCSGALWCVRSVRRLCLSAKERRAAKRKPHAAGEKKHDAKRQSKKREKKHEKLLQNHKFPLAKS